MSGNLSQILNSEQQQVLQIVSIENGQFVLDEKNLSRILLSADVRNDKVYIVSIVGAFRTGKSFLLTSFLKHVNSRLLEESATGETCFKWSYGSTPQTRGIWMSQRPVRYVNEANEQISILFMDTQGAFDNSTSQKECATIFSLSTFISSLLIYNIKNQIIKTDLEYLSLFAHFKQLSDRKFNKSLKLNTMTFLIRDWQFPEEYEYGYEGGEQFLKKSLNENKELTDCLVELFHQRDCFLLPHPGSAVCKRNFSGDLRELNNEYVKHSNQLFDTILQNAVTNYDTLLSGESVYNLFKAYIQVFQSQSMPNLESIVTVYCKHNNLISSQNEIHKYDKTLSQFLTTHRPFACAEDLEKTHQATVSSCVDSFSQNHFKIDDSSSDFESLNSELDKLYIKFKQMNSTAKADFIACLESRLVKRYELEIREFCSEKNKYIKPIELFFKHQQVKKDLLEEIIEYEHNREVLEYRKELSEKLDKKIELYDREISHRNANILSVVKKSSIKEYKKYMEENWSKGASGEKPIRLDEDKLRSLHLLGMEKSLNEFERLTWLDSDLNGEYESLVNDLNDLFANYVIKNQTKRSSATTSRRSLARMFNDFCQSSLTSAMFDKQNKLTSNLEKLKAPSNKPIDLIQSTILVFSLVFFLFSSYIMLLHDLISGLNIQYSTIFNYMILFLKCVTTHAIEILREFLGFCYLSLRNIRASRPNSELIAS